MYQRYHLRIRVKYNYVMISFRNGNDMIVNDKDKPAGVE